MFSCIFAAETANFNNSGTMFMKRHYYIYIGVAVLVFAATLLYYVFVFIPNRSVSVSGHVSLGEGNIVFTDSVRLKTTPVKNQGRSELCWIYSVLATIETDRLMQGDSVNLSVDYLARMYMVDQLRRYYFSRGNSHISMRGSMPMTLHLIEQYGAESWQSFHGDGSLNQRVLTRKLERMADNVLTHRQGTDILEKKAEEILDSDMGYMPRFVFMLGAEYTPMEFGHSVYMQGQYECLTSFTHHPFGERFVLEIPDNRMNDAFLNVPIDTLMQRIDNSLRNGRAVCWEGDISEEGFLWAQGVAAMRLKDAGRAGKIDWQGIRQREFETFKTTDDHCMSLVGIARDNSGRRYYIAKNSWGTDNRYAGYIYLSEGYVRLKTIAVCMKTELQTP